MSNKRAAPHRRPHDHRSTARGYQDAARTLVQVVGQIKSEFVSAVLEDQDVGLNCHDFYGPILKALRGVFKGEREMLVCFSNVSVR